MPQETNSTPPSASLFLKVFAQRVVMPFKVLWFGNFSYVFYVGLVSFLAIYAASLANNAITQQAELLQYRLHEPSHKVAVIRSILVTICYTFATLISLSACCIGAKSVWLHKKMNISEAFSSTPNAILIFFRTCFLSLKHTIWLTIPAIAIAALHFTYIKDFQHRDFYDLYVMVALLVCCAIFYRALPVFSAPLLAITGDCANAFQAVQWSYSILGFKRKELFISIAFASVILLGLLQLIDVTVPFNAQDVGANLRFASYVLFAWYLSTQFSIVTLEALFQMIAAQQAQNNQRQGPPTSAQGPNQNSQVTPEMKVTKVWVQR